MKLQQKYESLATSLQSEFLGKKQESYMEIDKN